MGKRSKFKKCALHIVAKYEQLKEIGNNVVPFLKMWGLYAVLFILIQLILSELLGISFNYKLVMLCSLLVSYLDYLKEH